MTPPPYGYPPNAHAPARTSGKPPRKVWDLVLTIVFLVGDGVLAMLMSFFGFFLAMASDPCGVRACSEELIGLGMITAVVLPWIVLAVTIVVAIILLVRRRIAFWVPLMGAVLIVGSWFAGAFIAAAGVPSG